MKNKKFWIGVVSKNNVMKGVDGGFIQLCHGKKAPLAKIRKGDWLVYYSSKEDIGDKKPYQYFTAVAEITGDFEYQFDIGYGFVPFRKDARFYKCDEADIRSLIPELSFIEDKKHWGYYFRHNYLEISRDDFITIWKAMNVQYK